MKITEKILLDGFIGITKGLDIISDIKETRIFWNFRHYDTDDIYFPVCDPENADCITLEYDRFGEITLDDSHLNHQSFTKIEKKFAEIYGTQVAEIS